MLLEEFLISLELTQQELVNAIHIPYQRVNEIINRRRGITPSTAPSPSQILFHISRLLDEPSTMLGLVSRSINRK